MRLLDRLSKKIDDRAVSGGLRSIKPPRCNPKNVDFTSNDYLGLSRNRQLAAIVEKAIQKNTELSNHNEPILGSSGSRLLSGNSQLFLEIEEMIAKFHGQKDALFSNSGWDLNFGIVSSICSDSTRIIYDEFSHNSLLMGIKFAKKSDALSFQHNNVQHLESLLKKNNNKDTLIILESIYSMDGDIAPIKEILEVAKKYDSMVLVDEAHSIGVEGDHGEGLIKAMELSSHPNLLGVVYTFGKAMGAHGAILATSHDTVVPYLVNYCSPIIYSTSMSIHNLIHVRESYQFIQTCHEERKRLKGLIALFQQEASKCKLPILASQSAIQGVVFPGNNNVINLSKYLSSEGFDCLPIRAPTVPVGSERLRIVLHSTNTSDEIISLCQFIKKYRNF